MLRARPLLLATLCTASCGPNIQALYDEAKLEALADPGPAQATWTPDGSLGLSWELVSALAVRELQQRLEDPNTALRLELPLGAQARVTPDLLLTGTELGPSKACETCIRVDAGFEGELDWALGGVEGSVPLSLDVRAVLEMATAQQADVTVVEARLRKASVSLPEDLQVDRLRIDLEGPLAKWIQEQVEAEFPAIPVAELGTTDVPLRAIRLETAEGHLLVHLLTTSPRRAGITPAPAAEGGWFLTLDEQVLLGLARRDAFEEGELDFGIHADPRGLALEGDAFVLGLRLWRLAGAGWWRDYRVSGTLGLEGERLQLEAEQVEEVDHSKGAGLVDPLALLAKSLILDAIEEALQVARPASLEEPIGGARLVLTVDRASGGAGALTLQGSARIEERAENEEKGEKKNGKKGGKKGGKGKGGASSGGARQKVRP